MVSLTVIKGPDQGKRFDLKGDSATLGRDADNAIRLHDQEASRHHAEVRRTGAEYELVDLESSNGTYVNGERTRTRPIKTGDRVRIGQSELLFIASPSSSSAEDLADKIQMITREAPVESSAIVRAMKQSEGSAFLRFPDRAESQWLRNSLSNLAVMYETSQAISRIHDLDELLRFILDLVFQTIKPDRGCIVLKDAETGKLKPSTVRFVDDAEGSMTISRTIADWVLSKEEGVIILDAASDERFRSSESVTQLGIREAICVPLQGRHDTLGVMYVDVKSDSSKTIATKSPCKFNDDHLRLMIAIAHQAGLAIEDTRFYEAMVQSERLAAVGQTIATLSHHIKNILQGIRSGSYLIESGLDAQNLDVLRQGWGSVRKNQEKIYNLVMDMLSFSKEREPALENADVNKIALDVKELMAARAAELGVELGVKLDPDLGEPAVDPDAIHRALLNLVTNAIDAVEGKPEGKVIVETACGPTERSFRIIVGDNGVGVSKEMVERIFQVFVSTKGAKGSGLGLPVSQKIAREHGGDILVASAPGKGSQFIMQLPRRTLDPDRSTGLTLSDLRAELEAEGES